MCICKYVYIYKSQTQGRRTVPSFWVLRGRNMTPSTEKGFTSAPPSMSARSPLWTLLRVQGFLLPPGMEPNPNPHACESHT